MAKIISIAMQKGGVGKTLSTINIGGAFIKIGHKVLMIDMDSQGNLTKTFFPNYNSFEITINEVLNLDPVPINEAIQKTSIENLHIVPANSTFSSFRANVGTNFDLIFLLRDMIDLIREDYDFILIDCPPLLGDETRTALIASQYVVGPLYPDAYTIEGVNGLETMAISVKKNLNNDLRVLGYFFNRLKQTSFAEVYFEQAIQTLGEKIFKTKILERTIIEQVQLIGNPIVFENPNSDAAQWYIDIASEIIERING